MQHDIPFITFHFDVTRHEKLVNDVKRNLSNYMSEFFTHAEEMKVHYKIGYNQALGIAYGNTLDLFRECYDLYIFVHNYHTLVSYDVLAKGIMKKYPRNYPYFLKELKYALLLKRRILNIGSDDTIENMVNIVRYTVLGG